MLIDTHCHLNFPDAFPDPLKTLQEAKAAGVGRLVVVGCDLESSRRAVEIAELHPDLFAVVGWHPTYTAKYEPGSLVEIESMLANPKVLALGEIGLDYHWDYATPEQQDLALFDQLDLAVRLSVPVVFHCREAYPALLDRLEARAPHPYLIHCFSGDEHDARHARRLDCYFGVDGPVTYKKADDLREVIRSLPPDRVVIETDSPYLSPVPFRGKPNHPAYVAHVNNALASLWGISSEESARRTTENAKRFFTRMPRT